MHDEEYKSHPSWGSLQISRVSGQVNLFGSAVSHTHFIEIRVGKMQRKHDLGQDWYYASGDHDLILQLSAAQFAEAITSLNMGSGTPCTLRYVNGKGSLPRPPEETTEHERVAEHVRKKSLEGEQEIPKYQARIAEILAKPSIGKADRVEIAKLTDLISGTVKRNIPFYTEQFEDAAERTVQKAKTEFEAMVVARFTDLGLNAAQAELLKLAPPKEKTDEPV